jgi:hypothetical protein
MYIHNSEGGETLTVRPAAHLHRHSTAQDLGQKQTPVSKVSAMPVSKVSATRASRFSDDRDLILSELTPAPCHRYADQHSQYVNKLLEDACKLKRKHAALKANKFIANKSIKAKTAAYDELMDQHKRLKKEKVQVESKLEEYRDQEGDATQERSRSESV